MDLRLEERSPLLDDVVEESERAIADFTQAINKNQNWGADSESYFGLPTAYFARGNSYSYMLQPNYQAAIEDYSKASELKKDYSEVYFERGNAHYHLKVYQTAIEDYDRAIDLKNTVLHRRFGRAKKIKELQP